MKQVKMIQAKQLTAMKRLKVAAYTRVSHTDLLDSLANQISHYSQLIQTGTMLVFTVTQLLVVAIRVRGEIFSYCLRIVARAR